MSEPVFRFKQFAVRHRDSAMKVGVDGVLLGAWATSENPNQFLDIGSGTGLISLMLAQRFRKARITAVEINNLAFEESKFNFENSPFSDRCTVIHSAIQNFKPKEKFDLIVSNPPYFEANQELKSDRSSARQQAELSFFELIESSAQLMNTNGNCAFIIPFDAEPKLIEIAEEFNLYPKKITRVRGNQNAVLKRSLILFSKINSEIETDVLTIEKSRNVYTDDYIRLTKDFYLKM